MNKEFELVCQDRIVVDGELCCLVSNPYESRSENIIKQIGRYFIDQLD